MNLVPYLLHMALYVLNTTRAIPREDKNLIAFLDQPKERWLESCYAADGPFYYAALALLIFAPARWKRYRVTILQRLLLTAHARHVIIRIVFF
jgi:E3 ubiquitin-protein ligase UBR4